MAVVYLHKNPETKEVFYVGMSTKDDLKRPYKFTGRNKFWKNYVAKHGEPIVEILEKGISNKEAWYLERSLIEEYGRFDLGLGSLLNMTDGGEFNENFNIETRLKISKSKLGVVRPKGFQDGEKNHRFGKGYLQTGENNPMYGRVGSNHHNSKKVLDKNTGLIYGCIKDCLHLYKYSYSYIKGMLNGSFKNKTSLIYVL